MTDNRSEQFAEALQALEKGDDSPMMSVFAEDAHLQRPQQDNLGAEADPKTFWKQYMGQFETIETRFERVVDVEDQGILEWQSTGKLSSGRDIDYAGVSLLTYDGDKVTRFATYYDTAAFTIPTE